MFGSIVDHAKLRLEVATTHYGGRIAVGIPIAIAAGFGIGGVYLLIERQAGALWACAIMTVAFLVIAIVVAMAVLSRERQQREALRQSARQSALMAGVLSVAPMVIQGSRRVARSVGITVPVLIGSVVLAALLASRSGDRHDEMT